MPKRLFVSYVYRADPRDGNPPWNSAGNGFIVADGLPMTPEQVQQIEQAFGANLYRQLWPEIAEKATEAAKAGKPLDPAGMPLLDLHLMHVAEHGRVEIANGALALPPMLGHEPAGRGRRN